MYRPIKSEVHALTHHLDGKKKLFLLIVLIQMACISQIWL